MAFFRDGFLKSSIIDYASLSVGVNTMAVLPPGESKNKDTRYLDVHEDDQLDKTQLAGWVKQASQLPGERM